MSLFVILSAFSVEGSVLCFGEDGHVAIEFVDACNAKGFGSQHAGAESDACGPCNDVQILTVSAYIKNASHYMQTLRLMSPSLMIASLPSKDYPGWNINLHECSYNKTLVSLHSVVLLI